MFGPDDPEARQGRRLMVTREGVLMHALYECDEGEMNYTLPCPKVLTLPRFTYSRMGGIHRNALSSNTVMTVWTRHAGC